MNASNRTAQFCANTRVPHAHLSRLRLTLVAMLATVVLIADVAAGEPNTAPAAAPPGARLDSAAGVVIGILSGRTTSFDPGAAAIGAYGVISARGYFADVLPSGALGQVLTLVYASNDCSGPAAIELSSVMGGPLPVPGYVFAFGDPRQIMNVPAAAAARTLTVTAKRHRTPTGYVCERQETKVRVYPVQGNRAEVSGFVDNYATPLAVRLTRPAQSATATTARVTQAQSQTGAGALMPSGTPQCAPGCYTAYIGDGICERECATSLCAFDGADCKADFVERAKSDEASLCAPACEAGNLGDGFCDKDCNVGKCEFDQGDCANQ